MKKYVFILILCSLISGCAKTEDEKATTLLTTIEKLNADGQYKAALDSIRVLRERFPRAFEARKKALTVWKNASLKLAQADIARTDSALQVCEMQLRNGHFTSADKAKLVVKRDSLQIRYDALCATVRVIRKK